MKLMAVGTWLIECPLGLPNLGASNDQLQEFDRTVSRSDAFDDAERALSRHNSRHLQPSLLEHRGEFLLRSLASADDQHLNIEELAPIRVVAGRDDVVDDEYSPFLVHSGAAVLENLHALLIVPVVEDVFHDVGIAARRHSLEETSCFEPAALSDSPCGHVLILLRASDHRGLVEQHALQLGVRFEDGGQQTAVAATDIHERADPGELIRGRNRRVLSPGETGHRLAEVGEVRGVLLEILEDRNTVGLAKRVLAGLHSIKEFLPGVTRVLLVAHQRPAAHRTGDTRLERGGERREFELAALGFSKDANTRQRAEDAVERRRLHARRRCQLIGSLRAALEEVGQFEFSGDVNEACDPVSDREV